MVVRNQYSKLTFAIESQATNLKFQRGETAEKSFCKMRLQENMEKYVQISFLFGCKKITLCNSDLFWNHKW